MKKIILLLLSMILMFSTLVGCKKGDELVNPVHIMNDFESVVDMQMFKPGRIDSGGWQLQQDYVTSGKYGVRYENYSRAVDGDTSTDPVWTSQTRVYETGEDWSRKMGDAFLITLDVYNPNDIVYAVGIRMTYGNGSTSVTKWVDCAPKQWTTVEYDIQKEFMPQTVINDRTGETAAIVNSISMIFRRLKTNYILYFDALKIYYNSLKVEAVDKTLEAGSMLSFDKSWHVNESFVQGENPQYNPTLLWAKDPDALDRNGVLKIQMLDRTDGSGGNAQPWIEFPGEFFSQKFGASNFGYKELNSDNEEVFVAFEDFTKDWSFCIDMKIPSGYDGSLLFQLYYGAVRFTYKDGWAQLKKLYPDGDYRDKWITLRWTIEELNWGSCDYTGYQNKGWANASTSYFKNLSRIRFELSSRKGAMPYAIYMDNFRMERTSDFPAYETGIPTYPNTTI